MGCPVCEEHGAGCAHGDDLDAPQPTAQEAVSSSTLDMPEAWSREYERGYRRGRAEEQIQSDAWKRSCKMIEAENARLREACAELRRDLSQAIQDQFSDAEQYRAKLAAAEAKIAELHMYYQTQYDHMCDLYKEAEQREKRLREAAAEHLRQCQGPGWNAGAHLEAVERLRAALAEGEK